MSYPNFKIEGEDLPIMLCGSSPFVGLGYFGFKATDFRIKFYQHPNNMAEIFTYFVEKGCKGAHLLCHPNILKAAEIAYSVESFPVAASLITTASVNDQLRELSHLKTVLVFVNPAHTDTLDEKKISRITRQIRSSGMIPGLATYEPGTSIPLIDNMDIDFSAYLVPVNKDGKYMRPNREDTLTAVTATRKKVIAMRPLAVGKILPEDGFPFVMEYCDGFCVGVTTKDQIDDAYHVLHQMLESV